MPDLPAGAHASENDPQPSAAPPLRSLGDSVILGPTADDPSAPSTVPAPTARAPTTTPRDRFTILRLHAQGGLGQVSLARDEKLKRQVALKEIRPDKRGNAYLRQRFLTEAEITGQLEHPGIVPIYDLEQDADGQVRYAMRFVQGRTLKDAIRDYHHRPTPLGLRELLQRFVSVCQTVAYAHSQGVIHRDLKPANVILGDYGETLVVDWGLAKRLPALLPTVASGEGPSGPDTAEPEQVPELVPATGDNGPRTQAGHVLGTPAFMAPEQAAGDIERTRTPADIYSLGAILYELLTGRPPYQGKNAAEVLTAVREGNLLRPTQAQRGVPRPLEAVCLKALAREIPERYTSAAELAKDVEHWLADERVSAYPEPWPARAGRFGRKHRNLVTSAAALLVTTVVGLGIGLAAVERERGRTAQERDEKAKALLAETKAHEAERQARQLAMSALSNLTDNVVEQQLARRTFWTEEDRRFLRDIQWQYEAFAALPGEESEQRAIRAAGRYRVGLMQFGLGEVKEAEQSYRQAVELLQPLVADFPSRDEYRRELAACHGNLGNVLRDLGQRKEAETAYTEARALWKQLAADFPTRPEYRQELALSHSNLGGLLRDQGRPKEAEEAYTDALAIRKHLAAEFPRRPEYREALAASHNSLGPVFRASGRLKEAETAYTDALALLKQLADEYPTRAGFRQLQASSLNNLGVLFQTTGRPKEAETAYTDALALLKQLVIEFPTRRPGLRRDLAAGYNNLGVLLRELGRLKEAETADADARAIEKQLAAEFPSHPEHRETLARNHNSRGIQLSSAGRLQEAETAYADALALRKQLAADFPTEPRHRNDLAGTLVNLAILGIDRRDFAQARRWLAEAQPHHQAALAAHPRHDTYQQFYRIHLRALTRSCAGQGDQAGAVQAAAKLRDLGWDPPGDAYHAARALALCVPLVEKDDRASATESDKQGRFYADQAMVMLRDAVAKGYEGAVQMKKDTGLDPLRKRADFQKLVAEVVAKNRSQ